MWRAVRSHLIGARDLIIDSAPILAWRRTDPDAATGHAPAHHPRPLQHQLLPTITDKSLRTYAQAILHPFSPSASSVGNPLLEPLSAQEQRVLTLLAAGRTNPQIASDLVISLNTVKGHLKNLYRKLDVTNRVTALETARHLKLI